MKREILLLWLIFTVQVVVVVGMVNNKQMTTNVATNINSTHGAA